MAGAFFSLACLYEDITIQLPGFLRIRTAFSGGWPFSFYGNRDRKAVFLHPVRKEAR